MQDDQALSIDEALARVLARFSITDTQRVGVAEAIGRVLATACQARWSLPSAPLSVMDGYALRSADLIAARDQHGAEALALERLDESAAGHPSELEVGPGSCVRISTGAVVPAGADAVVPQEDAAIVPPSAGVPEGRTFVEFGGEALRRVAPGRYIRPTGSDVREGEDLLAPGEPIGPGEAALLAACGHAEVDVRRRPKVAILSSGDELVPIGQTPGRGQVVSTNAMMLAGQIREAGGEPLDLGAVPDDPHELRAAIEDARRRADLLVCSGGISVGDHDLVLPALQSLGFELEFRRLRLRPGRPTTYGRLPPDAELHALPVLALPGNPASTYVSFELLARPLIRAMLGLHHGRWHRPRRQVVLAAAAEGDARREHYVRARLDGTGRAWPLDRQLSGALRSIAGFDLLLRVPAGRREVPAGEQLEALEIR
ncbi:molybdopterin molybdotransferase MoeA [Pseudenhygromyxa sp. WMMC2535]|uniref:molybdopterin molybdotransferase MoeA n=1 Tax=Pseudenhygromyxa sp. WMMC2535 TaxID=2712867 RepID=UPI0015538C66|nr:gephyrin-like molybdotransferase Glp [Pseudenhygromyxa sp. WMMC2535]NVB40835.1 molybdopterin molybdotransferase MoeA [Pseudenhygromyxa sp. WMMC2535]